MNRILTVEADTALTDLITEEWAKYGISVKRVATMNKAIEWLSFDDGYLFVAVNEDSSPDYLPQLRVMREVTDTPIFVITSSFTYEKRIKALSHGADSYDPLTADAKQNMLVLCALELLKVLNRSGKHSAKPPKVLTGGDIVLLRSSRTVLINNQEVPLGKKEFDILQCLMEKYGCVVRHKQLLDEVWNGKCGENTDLLWRTMNRLRSKLALYTPFNYIKIKRGVGYSFSESGK